MGVQEAFDSLKAKETSSAELERIRAKYEIALEKLPSVEEFENQYIDALE